MVEGIEGSKSYHDVILEETLKRKEILVDLSATRNPEANHKKFRAWKEIQDIVLVQCEKTMTIAQIKRVWRSKKASMRDVLRRQKLRQLLDGGCDLSLENSIVEVSPALTEAEIQLARCLVQEDVMRGHNKTAIFDEGGASDSSESVLEVTRRGWKDDGHGGGRKEEDGGRGRKGPTAVEGQPFSKKEKRRREDSSDFSESALEGMRVWRDGGSAERSTKEEGGRRKKKGSSGRQRSVWDSDSSESITKSMKKGHRDDGWARKRRRQEDERREEANSPELDRHELRRIRRKRVLQQLEDFDPDCSSSAESVSDKAIIDLQMKVLREEEVLIAKKSLALDIYMDVLNKQQQFYTFVLKRFQGSTEEKKRSNDPQQQQTFQSWIAPYSAMPMPLDLKSAATFL